MTIFGRCCCCRLRCAGASIVFCIKISDFLQLPHRAVNSTVQAHLFAHNVFYSIYFFSRRDFAFIYSCRTRCGGDKMIFSYFYSSHLLFIAHTKFMFHLKNGFAEIFHYGYARFFDAFRAKLMLLGKIKRPRKIKVM